MKIDEAISLLKQYIDYNNPDIPDFYTMEEAIKVIIKALEQEPCGDCISREAVMHILDEIGGDFDSPREAVVPIDYIADMVSELPFVTAQPKMGYWFIDERPESDREVVCSNCDKPIFKYHKLDFDYRPKYCPNCGAKMSEIPTGAEGSDKECTKNI